MIRESQLYRRFRASALTWQLMNSYARLLYWRQRAYPGQAALDAILRLKRDGIAVTHINNFFSPDVFDQLVRFGQERWEAARHRGGEPVPNPMGGKDSFLVDLWGGEHVLEPSHPLLAIALDQAILEVVNGYLGMCAKFREFWFHATIPVPPGATPFASQRWHADPDDRRMVKVFLYLNDVDESAGPFTYIRGTQSGGRWRHLFPFAPKRLTRHPDPAMIDRVIPKEDILIATGKAGSLIFCDTSGIHRGGYATRKHRLMWTGVYTTRASALPTRYRYAPNFNMNVLTHPAARYAVAGNSAVRNK